MDVTTVESKLSTGFDEKQSRILAETIIETIIESHRQLVKASDFCELKEIVRDLAKAQQRTEARVEELAKAQQRTEARMEELAKAQQRTEARMEKLEARMEELAKAQQRTEARMEKLEARMEDLAKAQQKTEARMEELAAAQAETQRCMQRLIGQVDTVKKQLGGLSRSVAYSLENEAYRLLPSYLKEHYGIEIEERMIRLSIDESEINIFAKGKQNGEEILLVGEVVLRLDDKGKFGQLHKNVEKVKKVHPNIRIVPLIATHYAIPRMLKRAKEAHIIVVQSFEW